METELTWLQMYQSHRGEFLFLARICYFFNLAIGDFHGAARSYIFIYFRHIVSSYFLHIVCMKIANT